MTSGPETSAIETENVHRPDRRLWEANCLGHRLERRRDQDENPDGVYNFRDLMLRSHLLHVRASEKEGEKIERRYRGGVPAEGPYNNGEEKKETLTYFEHDLREVKKGGRARRSSLDDVGVAFYFKLNPPIVLQSIMLPLNMMERASARCSKRREFE